MSGQNWAFSQKFSILFQTSRSELESQINTVKSSTPIPLDVLQELFTDLAKLTKSLADATGSLPSYDQRQYEEQLKILEKTLAELKSSSTPKSRFAFKRKAPLHPSDTPATIEVVEKAESPAQSSSVPTTNLTLSSRSYEYIAFDSLPQSALQQDLTISDLDHCIVNLIPPKPNSGNPYNAKLDISAVHVRNLTNTVLLLPPIDGSVLLHDISQSTLVLGCHQFRMHTSHKVDVYLSVQSNPIIEHCSNICFGAYPSELSLLVYQKASNHFSVLDFSHIRSTPSPHWSAMGSEGRRETTEWPLSHPDVEGSRKLGEVLEALLPR